MSTTSSKCKVLIRCKAFIDKESINRATADEFPVDNDVCEFQGDTCVWA